jgi:hypothetical protein
MGDNVQLRITAAGMNYIAGSAVQTTEEEVQTATQGQTAFTLSTISYTPGTNNIAVFVNGSKQVSGANYSETNVNTITFNSGLNAGDIVEFLVGVSVASGTLYATDIRFNPGTNSLLPSGTVESALNNLSDKTVGTNYIGYNEGGTGAVNRTLTSKLNDFISVKDFGAVGDGSTDDTSSILSCATYCDTNNKAMFFPSGTYNFTGGLNVTSNFGIFAEPGAQLSATSSSVSTTPCMTFASSIYFNQYYTLPTIVGYPGTAIYLHGASYVYAFCPLIANCKDGIILATDSSKTTCIDNTIQLNGMNNISNSCIQFVYGASTVAMQNNLFKANFLYTVKYGIFFNGTTADAPKVNENRFVIEALDGGGISGGVGIYAPNSNLTGPMYYEFKSSFVNFAQFFNVGNCSGQVIEAYFDMSGVTGQGNYGAFAISGTNKFTTFLVDFPFATAPVSASTTSNSRSTFNSGNCLLSNRQQLIGITPSGGMVAGDILTLYTYSPYTTGNGAGGGSVVNNLRVTMNTYNGVNLKLVPLNIIDNSNTVANEIKINFIAVGTVPASNGFEFTVDTGY